MMQESFDTLYTHDPVCPFCGHKVRDVWEINFGSAEGETEIDCGECEKTFIVSRHVTVDYCTYKPKSSNP